VINLLEADFSFGVFNTFEKVSCPNAEKFLFALYDGNAIESVLMRHDYGNALCISTQVGCNMGCAFCNSGRRNSLPDSAEASPAKIRDLLPYEMVLQILRAEEAFRVKPKISRVTLMGIGEPLDNFENVKDFIDIIHHRHGLDIAPRHITVSTCGTVRLDELHRSSYNIAISLHAPNNELRGQIMPCNAAFGLDKIIEFARRYSERQKKKITFEYVMLENMNDSDNHARELAELIKGLYCYVNLIPYNETKLGFKRPNPERISSFYSILIQSGVRAVVRKEFGGEIKAACGQLCAERNIKNHDRIENC